MNIYVEIGNNFTNIIICLGWIIFMIYCLKLIPNVILYYIEYEKAKDLLNQEKQDLKDARNKYEGKVKDKQKQEDALKYLISVDRERIGIYSTELLNLYKGNENIETTS